MKFSFILSYNTDILASNNPKINMYNCINAVRLLSPALLITGITQRLFRHHPHKTK